MIAARAANILMPAARNIIGASNKKPIMLHHTHQWTRPTSCYSFGRVSYHAIRLLAINFYPRPNLAILSMPALTHNQENFCGLNLL
jgi:hypothetical protein